MAKKIKLATDASTAITSDLFSSPALRASYSRWAEQLAKSVEYGGNDLRIASYVPTINAPISWLPQVVTRIRNSMHAEGYPERSMSTEWLKVESARAAIRLFENTGDLLPGEPHIYGTKQGDLVAEFETIKGRLTTVITDTRTILFAVLAADPDDPLEAHIQRGSNSVREEMKIITNQLGEGSNGKTLESSK